jgi:predicted Fe-Mo cluster-binding NifX family protein
MRIAIPVSGDSLDPHFGHCRNFCLVDVDPARKTILASATVDAPPHEPGQLPAWLAGQGAHMVLAGGMGARALQLFADIGVRVIVGVPRRDPETLVRDFLDGEIGDGTNACDH